VDLEKIGATQGGWLAIILYVAASAASWRVAEFVRRTRGYAGIREHGAWQLQSVLFVMLAANTALHGLDRLVDLFRSVAMDNGWYAQRRIAQSDLILALFGIGAVASSLGLYWVRTAPRLALLSLASSLILVTFILVRAVSLHAVDQVIFARMFGVTLSVCPRTS
jgi:hypothetical protein